MNPIVDHLFRHQYGKMVAVLTKIFGLSQLESIEDAVQDTFIKATLQWRNQLPENPEAWLMQAAKNRMIDLLRKVEAEKSRFEKLPNGPASFQLNELFLDHEVEDSQLRMIFVACHPVLHPNEQIAFALKTMAGFSTKEIAAALLQKEETIKKRLSRARKSIAEKNLEFEFPSEKEVDSRLNRVMDVIYLTFNEGFHSTQKDALIREDLCGEAIRLSTLLMKKERFRSGTLYALFATMCFHAARLSSKTNAENQIVDLLHQDRSSWNAELMVIGDNAMNKAVEYDDFSTYHCEAAIAAEHLKASTFADTNWQAILHWYEKMHQIHPTPFTQLNMAMVAIQLQQFEKAYRFLCQIQPEQLEQRAYLLHGAFAEFYEKTGDNTLALSYLDKAISAVSNDLEKKFLEKKRNRLVKT